MSLKNYLIYVKFLIVIYGNYIIGILFSAYYIPQKKDAFYFYVCCLFAGLGCGLIFIGITELLDWYPFEPLTLSSDETNILNNNHNTIDIAEKNLKDQEEIKNAKKSVCVWLVTTTVVFCVLFYTVFNI